MDGENDPLNLHSEDASVDRFRKIREELEAMALPDLPGEAELHAKIPEDLHRLRLPDVPEVDRITAKAWETKAKYDAGKRQVEKRQTLERDSAVGLGQGLTFVYTFLGMPLVGFGLGFLVDLWLKTAIFRGLGALAGATIGVWLALVQLNRNTGRN